MKRRVPTQHEMILAALKAGDRLTVLEALQRFDVYALSQRIGELKKMGHDIKSKPYNWTTEYGVNKTRSVYWMEPEKSVQDQHQPELF